MFSYFDVLHNGAGDGSIFAYVSLFVGAVTGVAMVWLKTRTPKTQKEAYEDIKKQLREMKLVLAEERKLRGVVEGKWENLKFSFHILYNEYEIKFKDDPLRDEKMNMLKDLKELFDL